MPTVAVTTTSLADRRSTIRNIVVFFALTWIVNPVAIATKGTLGRQGTH